MTPASQNSKTRWICLLLAAVTFLAYWNVTQCAFVGYDDSDFVTANSIVQAGLTTQGLKWAMTAEVARNWHPLTLLSHMLDCQFYGLNAGRHHLTNLLLHIANTLLLFVILRRITGALWQSAMVAALFALHPLHVESVAWVAERKDVLSAFFSFLTIWAYLRYAENLKSQIPNFRWFYALAVFFFALAALSKPMVVTIPFVLLLLDYWPLERFKPPPPPSAPVQQVKSKKKTQQPQQAAKSPPSAVSAWQLVLEKIPFFSISAALCWITFAVQKHGGAVLTVENLSLSSRLGNAVISYIRYGLKMFWPTDLAALYLRHGDWPGWQVASAGIVLVGLTAWIVLQARNRRWLAVGWFWYLGTLVPVIGIVQVGMQTMADRYTYIPLIGLFIILVWAGAEAAEKFHAPMFLRAGISAAALGACFVLTVHQIGFWKDSEALFTRMISVTKDNYMAHYNLGNVYSREQKFDLAIANYQAAIEEQPSYADARNNLAGVLLDQKRYDEAIAQYAEAARMKPEFFPFFNLANAMATAASARGDTNLFARAVATFRQALQIDPNSTDARNNLGRTLEAEGHDAEAVAVYEEALRINPNYELIQFNLANVLSRMGKLDEAIAHYEASARLNPSRVESFNGAGICYAMRGKMDDAIRNFSQVIKLNPQDSSAYGNLANALGSEGKLDQAIPYYQKAIQLNPRDFQNEYNLGITFLHSNRRDEAKTHFQAALRINPNYAEAQRALSDLDKPVNH